MFQGGKKSAPAPVRQSSKNGTAGLSFIGPDVLVSGDLTTTSQIHIDGRVDGDVRCDSLIMGEGGTVAGHIIADDTRIAGLVDGTVNARIVTLEPTAKVTGDVTYETLSIAAGASIDGRLARRQSASAEPANGLIAAPGEVASRRPSQPSQPALPALEKPTVPAVA